MKALWHQEARYGGVSGAGKKRVPTTPRRSGATLGRRAALRGGPEVWEVVSVGREYGDDREGLYEHFGWLERESVDQALKYHEHLPEEIRGLIEANERLGRYLGERLA